MKNSIILFILLTAVTTAQSNHNSLQQLKSEIKNEQNISINSQSPIIDLPVQSKKSVGLGVVYSLLLPGMGELYADSYGSGKYFTIADGILWGTLIGMNVYTDWKTANYKSYAESKAGVDNTEKDATYYARIGEYNSLESYNNEKALERNFDEMYLNKSYSWEWNSIEERRTYRDIWSASEQTKNDIRFVVGGLILNRIASAINAARLVTSYNNSLEEEVSWNFSVGFANQPNLPTSLTFNFLTSL